MTGAILLAAGASSRMGQPKQNLQYQGKSLLQHAIAAAQKAGCNPVVVVVGANAEYIALEVEDAVVHIVQNPGWQEGMASSIRAGLSAMQQIHPGIDQLICMLCDQPFADASLLKQLIAVKAESGKKMVASAYSGTLGVPVLFDKTCFEELSSLQGQEGARKLLAKHPEDIASVPFPLGAVDIDTPADYQVLKNGNV